MAAIQDYAKMWDGLLELLIDRPGGLGSGAGQGAAREKDGVAASRQAIPGKEPRAAAPFVFEDGVIAPGWKFVAGHDLTAHLQKKITWGNFGRTDRCAQIAEAACKGIALRITSQQGGGNITRRAVFL